MWTPTAEKQNKIRGGASLAVQWLRTHLPMQAALGFDPWSETVPRAAEQLSSHSLTAEPERPGACAPQQETPQSREAHTLRLERSPSGCNRESPCASVKTRHSQK